MTAKIDWQRLTRRSDCHARYQSRYAVAWYVVLLGQLAVVPLKAQESPPSRTIDFTNDVIPVLTKMGCNAGACHGAALGRGGFRLSLYGGDSGADYDSIVRQVGGRRVNLVAPDESLLLRKPAELVEHGGGPVLDIDSNAAGTLVEWLRQGALRDPHQQLDRFEVSPNSLVVGSLDDAIALEATAYFSDGARRDVTQWTIFTPEDPSAVSIGETAPIARVHRAGRHVVVARYSTEVVPIELVAPRDASPRQWADEPRLNFIDVHVLEKLRVLEISPSPLIHDGTYLRRVSIDLTGKLPSPEFVQRFLEDEDPDKRKKLVELLLQSDEFTSHWERHLEDWLHFREHPGEELANKAYRDWLTEQVRRDASYQLLARELIMASGDRHVVGAASFYDATVGPREQAELFSELFMGCRLRCANCHNHPLDRWTQNDYHGLAAIFAKVDRGRVVSDDPDGVVIHPTTRRPAVARIPGGDWLDGDENVRQRLADWLTDRDNPFFAKAIVNRLWKQTMGRGLVEPVDDFRSTNPATHPRLLNRLAEDFVDNGYSLRHTLRRIVLSATYARSSDPNQTNQDDEVFYSHAMRRPLLPSVLLGAMTDVIGVADSNADRMMVTTGLTHQLSLINGPILNARIAAKGSRLADRLNAGQAIAEIVDEFYLAGLCRHPTDSEHDHWMKQAAQSDPQRFLEDFAWGLLSSQEFSTNH
ncbi:MAG: DUF1549 and DUF1553 domain-containing protein [Planctomycetota bacterium]